jgi:GAF domain-containing protein/DNA-binding NarL/FixJ family response regulator
MNILLVGGDAESRAESLNALQLAFGDEVATESATSFRAVQQELHSNHYHIILDLGLSDETRWRLHRTARRMDPLVQVIMTFESNQEDLVADALQQGVNEALLRSSMYPAILPFIVERAYERYTLLEQRRRASTQPFDLKALDEFTQAATQTTDLSKTLDRARTALQEIDTLLKKSREELVKRRTVLRKAGSEVQRRERGLTALSDLAEAVSRSLDLESILVNILDQALVMTAADAGAVLVVEDESKPLRLVARKQLPDRLIAALSSWWPDASTFMTFLLSGKVLLVPDMANSDAPPELLDLLSGEGFTSMIGVPLQVGGNFWGGLMVATRRTEKLTRGDAHWLGVLGQQAGIAIENARLRTRIWEAAETWFRQSPAPSLGSETTQESQTNVVPLAQALDETKHPLRHRQDTLSAIVNLLGTAPYRPDVPVILQETLHHILEKSEAGGIWILGEPLKTLTLAAQAKLPEGLARSWPRQEWDQDDLLAPLMSDELVYLDDLSSPPDGGMIGQLKAAGAKVIVGIPLQIQGQSAGAMVIMTRQRDQLQAHDAKLLTAVGQQLGQALEYQKLHDDIRHLALKLVALREQREKEKSL